LTASIQDVKDDGQVGAWRRLVAHLNGVQGVVGSNPIAPTNIKNKQDDGGCHPAFLFPTAKFFYAGFIGLVKKAKDTK
jgi:hypothetical protein